MRPLVGTLVLLSLPVWCQELPPMPSPQQAMHRAASSVPSVQAARALWESAQGYARSIGSQPNPVLRLSGVSGSSPEESNALVFRFEIAGQPGLREESALQEAGARQADLQAERRLVALRTGLAYYTLWERQQLLFNLQSRTRLAEQLERSATRRFSVGEISKNQHLRSQLELARSQAELAGLEQEVEQARGLLNLWLGLPVAQNWAVDPAQGPLPQPPACPVSEPEVELAEAGLELLPEVKALEQESRAQEVLAELARRGNSPDLSLQLYRSRLAFSDVQGVQLTLSIPLWDWGQVEAETSRREGLARAAQARIAERQLQLRQQYVSAYQRFRAASRKLEILAEQARNFGKLAQDARRAYDANLMTLLEVFDVQQSFSRAVQDYITAQSERSRALLELGALRPRGFFEEVSREP